MDEEREQTPLLTPGVETGEKCTQEDDTNEYDDSSPDRCSILNALPTIHRMTKTCTEPKIHTFLADGNNEVGTKDEKAAPKPPSSSRFKNTVGVPKVSPSCRSLFGNVVVHTGSSNNYNSKSVLIPVSLSCHGPVALHQYISEDDVQYGSKSRRSVCSQCPRCRSLPPLPPCVSADGASPLSCDCRLCRLLLRAAAESTPLDLGAMCRSCGRQSPSELPAPPAAASAASATVSANAAAARLGHSRSASASLRDSFSVACREQGVQVSKWSLSSTSSCNGPLCRICHSPGDKLEPLMSPCRCSGSLKYVHSSCLLRWLEISRRKLHRAPHCELCGYRYQRHKIMRIRQFQCPPCSRRDKMLHFTFVIAIFIMVFCASATIICFRTDRSNQKTTSSTAAAGAGASGAGGGDKAELSSQEVVTLVCGVTFFCAFFLAMYVQVKAQASVYKLLLRFWLLNQHWHIDEYRADKDPSRQAQSRRRASPLGLGLGLGLSAVATPSGGEAAAAVTATAAVAAAEPPPATSL